MDGSYMGFVGDYFDQRKVLGSMKKKAFSIPFDNKWIWAAVSSAIIIPTVTLLWNHVGKVWAAPKKIEEIQQTQELLVNQTAQIGKYIDALQEKNKMEEDRVKKAPPGWVWSDKEEAYIVDVNYVPPKKKGK